MTAILGISAFYHDAAAALVIDGEIVAAAQEERFTRKKHDASFPTNAIDYCLKECGLAQDDLDFVVYYEKPLTKFERLLETYLAFAPFGLRSFSKAIPLWLKDRLHLRRTIKRGLQIGAARKIPLVFLDHHESHAASAFFPSPFEESAILTLDGVGEWSTAAFARGAGNKIELTHHLQFPHSLGLLYSAFTYYCGFRVNSGEYKLMGLAPYGQPLFADLICRHLIDIKSDGSFRLDMDYFNYCQGLTMTNRKFAKLFGGRPRRPESELTQRHMDLAASVQLVTEEILLKMASDLQRRTKLKNLVMAGGVALNCTANGRLLREGPFDRIWIQPAAGDAGGALGAALFVWHQLLEKPRRPHKGDSQKGSLLGPHFTKTDVETFLKSENASFEQMPADEIARCAAQHLADGKVVGWFQGRMEFGPRALGARSILADPRSEKMQSLLNQKIKFRESFRPFAPAVMREFAPEWFDLNSDSDSPYMLLTAPVRERHRLPLNEEQQRILHQDTNLNVRLQQPRSVIPAVTHIDYSARLQTVDSARNPRFHRLLEAFHELTGCPLLVNTSFNVRGEPIVCTPADAWRCFLATGMDILVMENCLVDKQRMDVGVSEREREELLSAYPLD